MGVERKDEALSPSAPGAGVARGTPPVHSDRCHREHAPPATRQSSEIGLSDCSFRSSEAGKRVSCAHPFTLPSVVERGGLPLGPQDSRLAVTNLCKNSCASFPALPPLSAGPLIGSSKRFLCSVLLRSHRDGTRAGRTEMRLRRKDICCF